MSEQFKTVPELGEALSVQGTDLAYTVVAPGSGGQDRKVTWATVGQYFVSAGVAGPTGPTGATGPVGPASLEVDSVPPSNTNILWADTSEPGDEVIPPGGGTGDVLAKVSGSDYDSGWVTRGDLASDVNIILASQVFG